MTFREWYEEAGFDVSAYDGVLLGDSFYVLQEKLGEAFMKDLAYAVASNSGIKGNVSLHRIFDLIKLFINAFPVKRLYSLSFFVRYVVSTIDERVISGFYHNEESGKGFVNLLKEFLSLAGNTDLSDKELSLKFSILNHLLAMYGQLFVFPVEKEFLKEVLFNEDIFSECLDKYTGSMKDGTDVFALILYRAYHVVSSDFTPEKFLSSFGLCLSIAQHFSGYLHLINNMLTDLPTPSELRFREYLISLPEDRKPVVFSFLNEVLGRFPHVYVQSFVYVSQENLIQMAEVYTHWSVQSSEEEKEMFLRKLGKLLIDGQWIEMLLNKYSAFEVTKGLIALELKNIHEAFDIFIQRLIDFIENERKKEFLTGVFRERLSRKIKP